MSHVGTLPQTKNASRIIVTTREETIARHCSQQKQENVYNLKGLTKEHALLVFTKKVLREVMIMLHLLYLIFILREKYIFRPSTLGRV